ncbi:alpha/beta hydrolase [Bacteroides sedimenti]|uniref:alpha/beta hydrolase n=1 Tax=Bacteroides sedimenti TaxID=2136147 RepID=UPI003340F8A3
MSTRNPSNIKFSENSLHYLIRKPKIKTDNPPLILLLHGVGSNEKDLFSISDRLPDDFLVVSARAPHKIDNGSYAWYQVNFSTAIPTINYEQTKKSKSIILQFISQLKNEQQFDEKRIYLCGFSQGAIMSYIVGLTRPDIVHGIAIMSGRLLDEIKPSIYPDDMLKRLKVFISHGTNDSILNIQFARDSLSYLKMLGINPTYKEYPEDHVINSEMLNDLIGWLISN